MGEKTLGRAAPWAESFVERVRRGAGLAGSCVLLAIASGCSNDDTPETALSQRQQSQTIGTVTVRIASGDIKDAVPTANSFLDLRDRSSIKSVSGTPLPLYNFGSVSSQVGAQVTSGSITSVASVLLRSQTVVQGNVTSGGTITTQAGVTVTGQKLQNQTIPAPIDVSWAVPLAASPSNPKTVNTNGTLTLAPGAYGKLTAYAGSKVNLSSGIYAFSDLQVEPNAALRFTVTPANGPVVLYVDKVTWMRGKVESTIPSIATAKSVLFVHRGTTTVRFEQSANMAIVSPSARIELATGGTVYQGSVFAKGLLLEPDVKLTYVPFEYWTFILPPRPTVSCVMPSGRGKYVAAFGYENGRPTTQQVPLGPLNRLDPNLAGPYGAIVPPTSFAPGSHDRVLWAPLDANGTVRWLVLGQTAEANLSTTACEFGSEEGAAVPTVFSEGRTPTRASIPSVPAPRKAPLALMNALGPGRFHTQQAVPVPPSPPGSPPPVSDPNLPAVPGVRPDIPMGLVTAPTTTVRLDVNTALAADGWPEGVDLRAFSNLSAPPNVELSIPSPNSVADHSVEQTVAGTAPLLIRHQQIEYNQFSDHESAILEVTLDPVAGTFSGFAESGRIEKSWLFPLPITISNYAPLNTQAVTGTLGVPLVFPFQGGNTATYTISAATPSTAVTKICPKWTAYFVDEELPQPGGATESFKGTSLDGGLRVRGYPASFARFELSVKGLFGSFQDSGRLDRDGCTGDIPALVLQYDQAVTDGSARGVVLHMKVDGDLVWTGPVGDVAMPVRVLDAGGAEVLASKTIHLTDFGDEPGWSSQVGVLTPPPELTLSTPDRDHGTTGAATVSHFLRRLDDLGVDLPAGTYPVNTFGTDLSVTKDYLGNQIVESGYSPGLQRITIGPAFFQCGDPPSSAADCRRACATDTECPGGQHCAKALDPADGCEGPGNACFCAWPDQGTSKFVTSHELGHLVQNVFTGTIELAGSYTFACVPDPANPTACAQNLGRLDDTGGAAFPNLLYDPPLMDPACGCSHVELGAFHCLQSIERISRADSEGFAQFFASLVWNDPSSTECVFNYYKEFLDEGPSSCRVVDAQGNPDPLACQSFAFPDQTAGTVTLPPMSVDCGSPAKWRNQNRCAVDDQVELMQKSAMGTEMDWMTFLYAVQKQVGLNQLLRIYNHACHPELPFDPGTPADARMAQCGGGESLPIAWVDVAIGGKRDPVTGEPVVDPVTNVVEGLREHGGFLSGAARRWGDLDPIVTLIDSTGDAHGVSADTTPAVP